MKSSIIKGVVVAGLVTAFVPQMSYAASEDVAAEKMEAVAKSNGETYLCQKGDLLGRKMTFRTGNGEACAMSGTIAAISQLMCKGKAESFDGSQCDVKGLKKLNGEDPTAYLKNKLKMGSAKVKKFACSLNSIKSKFADACAPAA